jgi:hypothetical protein
MLTSMVNSSQDHLPLHLLALDIDLRLGTDLWAALWETAARDDAVVAALIRHAYGSGYTSALTEARRGQMCRDHGLAVPTRAQKGEA